MLTRFINSLTKIIGQCIAWLLLVMAIATTIIVILRYGFNQGSIILQESVIYCHAIVFLLGAAYTLQDDEHVRVDVLYRHFSERGKALANLFGTLFLLQPVCIFIIWISWDYVAASWHNLEKSNETGGIPALFLLKTLIPLMSGLLSLQGLAQITQQLQTIFKNHHG